MDADQRTSIVPDNIQDDDDEESNQDSQVDTQLSSPSGYIFEIGPPSAQDVYQQWCSMSKSMITAMDNHKQFLIYYTLGNLFIRPAGLFTGSIKSEYLTIIPYILRRSNGEIRWLPYDNTNYTMLNDFNYVMELNVAAVSTTNVTIVASGQAQVYVYGEFYRGFSFDANSVLELKGTLFIGNWTQEGLVEECVNRNCIVEVSEGTVVVFLCDYREIVILRDNSSRYYIKVIEDNSGNSSDSNSSKKRSTSTIKSVIDAKDVDINKSVQSETNQLTSDMSIKKSNSYDRKKSTSTEYPITNSQTDVSDRLLSDKTKTESSSQLDIKPIQTEKIKSDKTNNESMPIIDSGKQNSLLLLPLLPTVQTITPKSSSNKIKLEIDKHDSKPSDKSLMDVVKKASSSSQSLGDASAPLLPTKLREENASSMFDSIRPDDGPLGAIQSKVNNINKLVTELDQSMMVKIAKSMEVSLPDTTIKALRKLSDQLFKDNKCDMIKSIQSNQPKHGDETNLEKNLSTVPVSLSRNALKRQKSKSKSKSLPSNKLASKSYKYLVAKRKSSSTLKFPRRITPTTANKTGAKNKTDKNLSSKKPSKPANSLVFKRISSTVQKKSKKNSDDDDDDRGGKDKTNKTILKGTTPIRAKSVNKCSSEIKTSPTNSSSLISKSVSSEDNECNNKKSPKLCAKSSQISSNKGQIKSKLVETQNNDPTNCTGSSIIINNDITNNNHNKSIVGSSGSSGSGYDVIQPELPDLKKVNINNNNHHSVKIEKNNNDDRKLTELNQKRSPKDIEGLKENLHKSITSSPSPPSPIMRKHDNKIGTKTSVKSNGSSSSSRSSGGGLKFGKSSFKLESKTRLMASIKEIMSKSGLNKRSIKNESGSDDDNVEKKFLDNDFISKKSPKVASVDGGTSAGSPTSSITSDELKSSPPSTQTINKENIVRIQTRNNKAYAPILNSEKSFKTLSLSDDLVVDGKKDTTTTTTEDATSVSKSMENKHESTNDGKTFSRSNVAGKIVDVFNDKSAMVTKMDRRSTGGTTSSGSSSSSSSKKRSQMEKNKSNSKLGSKSVRKNQSHVNEKTGQKSVSKSKVKNSQQLKSSTTSSSSLRLAGKSKVLSSQKVKQQTSPTASNKQRSSLSNLLKSHKNVKSSTPNNASLRSKIKDDGRIASKSKERSAKSNTKQGKSVRKSIKRQSSSSKGALMEKVSRNSKSKLSNSKQKRTQAMLKRRPKTVQNFKIAKSKFNLKLDPADVSRSSSLGLGSQTKLNKKHLPEKSDSKTDSDSSVKSYSDSDTKSAGQKESKSNNTTTINDNNNINAKRFHKKNFNSKLDSKQPKSVEEELKLENELAQKLLVRKRSDKSNQANLYKAKAQKELKQLLIEINQSKSRIVASREQRNSLATNTGVKSTKSSDNDNSQSFSYSSSSSSEKNDDNNKSTLDNNSGTELQMNQEIAVLRNKMTEVVTILKNLINNITDSLRKELNQDLERLEDCSKQLTPELFDLSSAQIAEIVKNIDQILSHIK